MTLSADDRHYMALREEHLSATEKNFIDNCFAFMYDNAKMLGVKAAGDDRAAALESAFIRFVIESREPL